MGQVGDLEGRVGGKGAGVDAGDFVVSGEDKLQALHVEEGILWQDLDFVVVQVQELQVLESLELKGRNSVDLVVVEEELLDGLQVSECITMDIRIVASDIAAY